MRRMGMVAGLRALLVVGLLGWTSAPAHADWSATPWLGVNFGGDANFGDVGDFSDNFEKKAVFGGTVGWMGKGIIGLEADFGFAPNFFANTTGDADFDFGDSNLTTVMGNLIIGVPVGGSHGPGVRPYGSGGIGLIRTRVDGAGTLFDGVTSNDLGVNVGGGVVGYVNDHVGIRGDVRYFRSLRDTDGGDNVDFELADFRFWRASVGVTFRFGNGQP